MTVCGWGIGKRDTVNPHFTLTGAALDQKLVGRFFWTTNVGQGGQVKRASVFYRNSLYLYLSTSVKK